MPRKWYVVRPGFFPLWLRICPVCEGYQGWRKRQDLERYVVGLRDDLGYVVTGWFATRVKPEQTPDACLCGDDE